MYDVEAIAKSDSSMGGRRHEGRFSSLSVCRTLLAQ